MRTLDELCIEYGTDKGTKHPIVNDGNGHGYAPFYDSAFTPVRTKPIKFLEVGVGGGESIRAWLEYFPEGKIYGVDIVSETNPYNTPNGTINRYTFCQGDQSCPTFWACYLADHGRDWDIIVEDGGHYDDQVINTFACLWPHVVPGGLYCIEDLACAYAPIFRKGDKNPVDLLKGLIDSLLNKGGDIEEIRLSNELAIIRKKR